MSVTSEKTTMKISQLCVAPDNPRHEEVNGEIEAIRELCKTENIEVLARDIQLHGISPAERLIVMAVDEDEDNPDIDQYFVAEGNRRICALKLLHDPELAPSNIRKQIQTYADKWIEIDEVDVVVIRDAETRRFWMQRIHDGEQGGKGRKRWNAEQKTRFSGTGRNMLAQALLDYSEEESFLRKADRAGRLSHMARLAGNALVKEALGAVVDRGYDDLHRIRKKADFDFVLQILLEEARTKSLGSQANKTMIDGFVRTKITGSGEFSNTYLKEPEPIRADPADDKDTDQPDGIGQGGGDKSGAGGDDQEDGTTGKGQGGRGKPAKPAKRRYIPTSSEIEDLLSQLENHKLQRLYFSICSVNVRDHPLLIGVGIWSFFESLASLMGASENMSFSSFYKPGRLSDLGVAKGDAARQMNKILEDLGRGGNLGKHHAVAGQFDPDQLMTNWEAMDLLIVKSLSHLLDDK